MGIDHNVQEKLMKNKSRDFDVNLSELSITTKPWYKNVDKSEPESYLR